MRRRRGLALPLIAASLALVIGPAPAQTPSPQSGVADSLRCPATLGDIAKLGKDQVSRDQGGRILYFVCAYWKDRPEIGGTIDVYFRVDWAIVPGTYFTCKWIQGAIVTAQTSRREMFPSDGKAASGDYGIVSPAHDHRTHKDVRAKYLPLLKTEAEKLLARVEGEAVPCEAEATPEGSCKPEGVVTGRRVGRVGGAGIEGIKVELRYGTKSQIVAADAQGRYRFTRIGGPASAGFDPATDQVRITVVPAEWVHQRFVLLHNDTPMGLSSDFFKLGEGENCRRDFDASAIPSEYTSSDPGKDRWPDIIEIYYRMQRAWRLGELLKVDVRYGLPLKIRTFCTSAEYGCRDERGAFARVSQTGQPPVTAPFIAMPTAKSVLTSGSWPDNREYHEFAHYFQAASFGAVPYADGSTNHGGYYVNKDSADSWAESFAEWFSMMVSKHVDLRPYPELYRVDHAYRNFENDYRAWTHGGKAEELALAGLLLDFEDGAEDYAAKRSPPEYRIECCQLASGRTDIAYGLVTVISSGQGPLRAINYSEATQLWVTVPGAPGRFVPTFPADIEPGESAMFGVPLPAGADPSAIKVVASETRRGDVGNDDDPMDVTLPQMWNAIVSYKSKDARGNGHAFDVADLYRALKGAFGGRDADKDGLDDVDQVFIAHGFFADLDGDHSYEKGETVGLTSHPAAEGHGAQNPRFNTPSFEEEAVTIDTGDVASNVIVEVSYPATDEARSYGYVVRTEAGKARITMPPPESKATVTLIAVADGYEPALLGTIDPATFWTEAGKNQGRSFLSYSARMTPMASQPQAGGGGGTPVALIAGVAAALLLAAATFFLRRRRPAVDVSPAPAPPAVLPPQGRACPSCGAVSPPSAFCIQCGTRLS